MVISLDLPISELILEIKGISDQSFLWLQSVTDGPYIHNYQ